jgi:tyrosyl-tRNA synthetase
MDAEARLDLITRNTEEIISREELIARLNENDKLSAYIGRATTGPFHIGHLIAIGKMLDFQNAGVEAKVLLADIHAALDDQKAKWEELSQRAAYTQKCVELALKWKEKPTFVKGSDFQLKSDYVLDALKIASVSTVERATRAASEVTRMKNPKVSELIYPIFQALDEQYLDVDIQLGGLDQRHILVFAREYLPMLGYRKRIEIMTPLISSLLGPGTKMSSSIPESNIKIYDSVESTRRKIDRAYCPEGVAKDNFILQLTKFLIFTNSPSLKIERENRFGGDVEFKSYGELEGAFVSKRLHPKDLKTAVADFLI